MKKSVAIIGLGPHAQRIYYPYLSGIVNNDKSVSLELIIDLDINKNKIEKFLSTQNVKPKHKIYLSSADQIAPKAISPIAAQALKKYSINRAILSTEPKAHRIYLEECIKRSIPVVVDKPITVPIFSDAKTKVKSYYQADKIYRDVIELQDLIESHPRSRVLVECQRRNHNGYLVALNTVRDIVRSFGVPVTFIQVHHSDGMWNMPDEFTTRENHPYKYGYGKLMHSGYHFVDLLVNILKISDNNQKITPDTINIFTQTVKPTDQHLVLSDSVYENFFGSDKAQYFKTHKDNQKSQKLGEVDSFSQIQTSRQGKIVTTVQLSLMQSGFSRRAWPALPEDAYKSNGRVRHEFVNIHIGALGAIQVHSYQAREASEQGGHPHGVGDTNHFDIHIYRNSNLIGGEPIEVLHYGEFETMQHREDGGYLGHNESARYKTLDELIYDLPSNSELISHLATNKFLSAMHRNHLKQEYGKIPNSRFAYKEFK